MTGHDRDHLLATLRVAVLGARVFDTLFEGRDPIRETIRLRGIPFEVIGVLEAKGVSADSDEDDNPGATLWLGGDACQVHMIQRSLTSATGAVQPDGTIEGVPYSIAA